ncbi:MAG TPA: hypothetical protein P5021_01040, partial [Candidatus Diapherotrites archaeon]|nr:hypothetical protein [Candidatus Diapherotrites archaeon]
MNHLTVKKALLNKGLAFLMIFTMLFSSLGSIVYAETWSPQTKQPVLVVTGQGIGLENEKSYTKD